MKPTKWITIFFLLGFALPGAAIVKGYKPTLTTAQSEQVKAFTEKLNGAALEMVLIPAGTFRSQ
jgi:hypothetical protein